MQDRSPLGCTLILLLAFVFVHCYPASDQDRASAVLEAEGYTEIHMTGWDYWGCGEDDFYTDGFIATSVNGSRVDGVVCCGLFKSCTVRIDHIQPARETP